MYDPSVLAEQLRVGRDATGFTLQTLAKRLDVSMSAVQKWEKGVNKPNAEDIARIAEIEQLDIAFYFTRGMKPAEADLRMKRFAGPLAEATERLSELQRVSALTENDPVIAMVKRKAELYELAQSVYLEEATALRRLNDFVQGVLYEWKAQRAARRQPQAPGARDLERA